MMLFCEYLTPLTTDSWGRRHASAAIISGTDMAGADGVLTVMGV